MPPCPADAPAPEPLAPFRLVVPSAKRDRLARKLASLGPRRPCGVLTCGAEGLAVVVVDSEIEAVLCPRHALVDFGGQPIPGQPIVVTSAW